MKVLKCVSLSLIVSFSLSAFAASDIQPTQQNSFTAIYVFDDVVLPHR
jgi:hypothetical protein